ncbi:Protease Do-like 9, partial [Tetrabaena socialis]
ALACDANQGFQDIVNIQVHAVNGVKVHNLQHLATLVEGCAEEYVRFDLEWKRVIVLHTASARAAMPDILRANCIPAPHSEGLLAEPLLLPSDLAATRQPDMADSEVVGTEEAVAVGEQRARL